MAENLEKLISLENLDLYDEKIKDWATKQIANSSKLSKEIVTSVPDVSEAKENVIYMVKDETVTGDDRYNEYTLINGEIVKIGDTSVDLSEYVQNETLVTELNKKVNTADVQDNLESADTVSPLSAKQGKVLNEKITEHTSNGNIHVTTADKSNWNGKFDSNQGAANAGKLLGTNSSGDVVAIQGYGFEYNEETKMLEYGTDPTTNLNQGIGLDDTLSKKGFAADSAAVGELKEDLSNIIKITKVEGRQLIGSYYVNLPLVKNVDYKITNDSPDMLGVASANESKETIEFFHNLDSQGSEIIRPTQDAFYLKLYFVEDGTAIIENLEGIAQQFEKNVNQEIPQIITVDVNGNGDYTSFTDALYNNLDAKCKIIVKKGTYDIVSEYVALFGQNVVDTLSDETDIKGFQFGAIIRNKEVVFETGAKLVCDWTGHTVDYSTHRFSALRVDYNVKIIGMDLEATNVYYVIHDDYGLTDEPYTNIYENCRIVGHNVKNQNCIGGGCKKYTRIIIKNCYLSNNANLNTARYHNTNVEGAVPEIFISGTYFNYSFNANYYGSQTSKMRVYVNNCYAPNGINKQQEAESYSVDNVELIKWNNTEN